MYFYVLICNTNGTIAIDALQTANSDHYLLDCMRNLLKGADVNIYIYTHTIYMYICVVFMYMQSFTVVLGLTNDN